MSTPTASAPPTDRQTAAQERLDWARQIALEAGQITLEYFRSPTLGIDWKGDGSPVTVADRTAEQHLRKRIEEKFPSDAILGEEYPEKPGDSGYKWILDPIDGTKPFMHGVPLYTNLVAVLEEASGEPILGVINAPASGETIHAAVGGGAWYQNGDDEPYQARVSQVESLSEGLFLTGDVAGFRTDRENDATDVYFTLQDSARISRTWGDAYGYMMVAIGRAEVDDRRRDEPLGRGLPEADPWRRRAARSRVLGRRAHGPRGRGNRHEPSGARRRFWPPQRAAINSVADCLLAAGSANICAIRRHG